MKGLNVNIAVEIYNGEGTLYGKHFLTKHKDVYMWVWIVMTERKNFKNYGTLQINDERVLADLIIPFKEEDLEKIEWK